MIREANNEDTYALEEIFLITRQNTFIHTPSDNFKIGDYKKSTEGEEVWLSEENGNIIGFISLWLPDNFIHNLFVHPNCQGRGIGKELLIKAEERLSRPIELKVRIDNQNACIFYKKHGYKKISTHENEPESYMLFRKN